MSAPVVPPALARRIVLRHLPRFLRAGLDGDGLYGRVPATLARDASTLDDTLGDTLARWLDREPTGAWVDGRFQSDDGRAPPRGPGAVLARIRRRMQRLPGPETVSSGTDDVSAIVGLLDGFATTHDCVSAREIADALLVLTARPTDRAVAARLAGAAWRDMARIDETAAILRLLDLAAEFDDDSEEFLAAGAPRVPPPRNGEAAADLRRAWHDAIDLAVAAVRVQAHALALGLSAFAVGEDGPYGRNGIGASALRFGELALEPVERRARAVERRRVESEAAATMRVHPAFEATPDPQDRPERVPEGHVMVCRTLGATGSGKGRDVTKGYERSIGRALPLVRTPDLAVVQTTLLAEFPQAADAIDMVLRDLVGRDHVRLSPLLILGAPGSGKSRFARRLGETLGIAVYRVDGSNDAGSGFGGTERRWYSSEPCRPFMAVNRAQQANPLVLVDEIDKAPTRSDYGRLWDGMISFLEPETAARFPDPCIQAELDVSWVSVVATANGDWMLPAPLVDRLRIVDFPMPRARHLEALLPALLGQVAAERGLDPGWFPPLDAIETAGLRRIWGGGSVRRLRRLLDGVLRVRERTSPRH